METENAILKFLIEIITIENVVKFFVLYFIIIWIFLIVWVAKDISNRTQSSFMQVISVLIMILFTPLGIFLYLLIRPWKTLFDQYSEEIEENLKFLNDEVKAKIWKENFEVISCPQCKAEIEKEFKFCPSCKAKLKKICENCWEILELDCKKCPSCWDEKKEKKKKKKKKKSTK